MARVTEEGGPGGLNGPVCRRNDIPGCRSGARREQRSQETS